jgi:putative oxidoreductase
MNATRIIFGILQALIGTAMLLSGTFKQINHAQFETVFAPLGVPAWTIAPIGIIEIIAGILILSGFWLARNALLGTLISSVTMLGASLANLRVGDILPSGDTQGVLPAAMLLLVSLAVLAHRWRTTQVRT